MGYKKAELEQAEESLQDFCERFNVVITISNAKGMWLCRATRNHVQVFLATGQTLFGCMVDASYKASLKRQSLGV